MDAARLTRSNLWREDMTCEAFDAMLKVDPLLCTLAERDAMRMHGRKCAKCLEMVFGFQRNPVADAIAIFINAADFARQDSESLDAVRRPE